MRVEQMREKISGVYDSVGWRNRVAFMPDNQVIAIYHTMLNTDKFVKRKKDSNECEQIYMFTEVHREAPKTISDKALIIGFDSYGSTDEAVLTVSIFEENKLKIIHALVGEDAVSVYNKLTNNSLKGESK